MRRKKEIVRVSRPIGDPEVEQYYIPEKEQRPIPVEMPQREDAEVTQAPGKKANENH